MTPYKLCLDTHISTALQLVGGRDAGYADRQQQLDSGWFKGGWGKEFPYSWFEMVFDLSTDEEQSGHTLIGQTDGQAV